jgi:heptaprenyl diphosphate synthase
MALLGALSLFLSAVDYLLPKPLPFMRIGLANLSLLLALSIPAGRGNRAYGEGNADFSGGTDLPGQAARPLFSPQSYCLLALLKVTGQAFITGHFLSYVFLFSLAGSAVSAAVMYGLRRLFGVHIGLAGISVAGAFASNSVQLVLARFFLFGESAVYLAPPFLIAGIVSGAALGIFAEAFAAQSRFLRDVAEARKEPQAGPAEKTALRSLNRRQAGQRHNVRPPVKPTRLLPLFRFFSGLVAAIVFLAVPSLIVKTALFFPVLLLAVFAAPAGKKPRLPVTLAVITGIVVCNLFPPFGRIFATAGPFTIALGSLESGVRKALNFEGLVMLSKLVVPANMSLPGAFGKLLAETFRILEKLNKHRGLLTGRSAAKNGPDNDGTSGIHENSADNSAQKKRFMERLDKLLLELNAGS